MRKLLILLFVSVILVKPLIATESYEDTHGKDVSISYAFIYLNVTNEAPQIVSLELAPATAYEDSDITCNATSTDREHDTVNYHYAWFVNNNQLEFSQRVLPHEYIKANDVIMCEATPYDKYEDGTSARASIIINKIPIQSKVVKTTLAAAGVKVETSEIATVTKKGLVATTGFVVKEVAQSSNSNVTILVVVLGLLVVVNLNLLLRLRKTIGRQRQNT